MFEWDTSKAAGNHAKHGVSFEEAATVFGDSEALDGAVTGRVLIVAYTVRRRDDDENIRIISARRASRQERAAYAAASGD